MDSINVLIATHGRPLLLERTLASLEGVRRPPELQQILIVENGSDDGARDLCSRFIDRLPIAYHHRREPGKTPALQWAINTLLPRGLIVFFDDDIRLSPGVLTAYADAARINGPKFYYGGPLGVDYEQPPPPWLLQHLPSSAKGWCPSEPEKALQRTRFLGANYGVFAEAFQAIGGFNPIFGPGEHMPPGEETDLQDRLYASGCRPKWIPDALVWHYIPRSRCTPAWALHRKYRHAITEAMGDDSKTGARVHLLGVPVWQWRLYFKTKSTALGAAFSRDPQAEFKARADVARVRGWMRASRLKRRRAVSDARSTQS